MSETETSQEVVHAPRNQSETLDWLSRQTGTEVKEVDGQVVISFGPDIEKRVNALAPVSQVAQVTRDFSPSPRVVQLNIESDAFEPNKGKFSLNKVGLSKLADLAQIEVVGQQKRYLGLQGMEAIVTARMRGPDGTWKLDTQTKTVFYEQLKRQVERRLKATAKKYKKAAPTQEDIDKAYDEELEFVAEKASTKAFLRCVRKLLSVKGTYTRQELQKPFLVITWGFTPDWSNPRVAEMLALQYREGSQELYGAETPALPSPSPAEDIDVLPDAGQHAAAALNAAASEADELEEAEEEAEAATDPPPGQAAAPPAEEPEGDPEAWDLDEDEMDPNPARPEKPTVHFKPSKGPFAGKDVEEIVASPEGKLWLAKMVKALRSDEKRAQALGWLEWGTSGEVTAETLDEFLESASA